MRKLRTNLLDTHRANFISFCLLRAPHSWFNQACLILGVRLSRKKFAQVYQLYPVNRLAP
jgi:hypothetical protein